MVQAYVRSFLTRKKNKQHFRTLFDNTVTNLKKKWPSVDILIDLIKKLAFFHESKIDTQRLVRRTYLFSNYTTNSYKKTIVLK